MIDQINFHDAANATEPISQPTNGHARECPFCQRSECACTLTPEELSASAARVRSHQEKHKPERDEHKTRMAELHAEAEPEYMSEDFRQIVCTRCDETDLASKDD